ncbi:putative ATP-binding protein involved in virulence [Agrobacterium tumefaciens]|nr:putative ATP-binding protein involved in virulence [Agrobacterium tumefaciens]
MAQFLFDFLHPRLNFNEAFISVRQCFVRRLMRNDNLFDDPSGELAFQRGRANSLVESFTIYGLYQYRTVSLESDYAATIIIAKNGSGKTTLLSALNAVLKGQYYRLRELDFSYITLKLRSTDLITISQQAILEYSTLKPTKAIMQLAAKIDVEPVRLHRFILEDFEEARVSEPGYDSESKVVGALYRGFSYNWQGAIKALDDIQSEMLLDVPQLYSATLDIRQALADIEILYLPTYRRIELPLEDTDEVRRYGRKKVPVKVNASGLFTGDIQFGLSDISARLAELNQHILYESNIGYREISANIINELLNGTFERETGSFTDIPDKEDLEIFFSRLKDQERHTLFGEISVPDFDKIYTGRDISGESNRFLTYFLSKLNRVINATRDIEARVEDFILSCNRYLSSVDPSTQLSAEAPDALDGKKLVLSRRNLQVHVESTTANREISLDALSSGEKQMISLFAKLFLYTKDKLIRKRRLRPIGSAAF